MNPTGILVTGVGLALPGASRPADLLRSAPTAGEPAVDPAAVLGRRGLRYKDRASQLALCAARDGLRAAGLLADELTVPGGSVGVVVSSNLGNLDTVCGVADEIRELGVNGISPMGLPNASSNVIASSVAIRYGLRGPNLMVCNGATSGLDAVYWGAAMVAAGRAERILVVGVETRNRWVSGLSGAPEEQLLDGAVALVLERAEAAEARGAVGTAVLGRYARGAGEERCLDRLLDGSGEAPVAWFVPEGGPSTGRLAADVPRSDLSEVFGRSSGALGVLQCAAATGWFAANGADGRRPVLVTSGTDRDDAVAGFLLTPVGAAG
ncbi:beta-ketoacyl synthase N-terminal-like domain-containing protein [Saccharothrix sp. ST-888]|uniref:beta-ketoacyl synthase N-terminal-like domain-containing protein n=1 Tax=Saccharothrix sp. ST-888 TaxID=1427391 RepID=UPI0005EC719A|nr:beta-ketoacyl synthase N-terminal-like domain-containing protein [Saccharothrix sp. ST-888]KJK59482.1 beta-ketoacyl synthase [Saccharothrix sp. ST-888]